jgi:hypothetical protein
MLMGKLSVAMAALSLSAIVAPIAGASGVTTPAALGIRALTPPRITFIPPRLEPTCFDMGQIIVNGKPMAPRVHMCTSGISLPSIAWPPA